MYQGKHVNNSRSSQTTNPYPLDRSEKARPRRPVRKKRKNKGKKILIGLVIVLALIEVIFLAAMWLPSLFGSNLNGLWSVDGITKYEFQRGGKGALVLPSTRYDFVYQDKDGAIAIDFVDEALMDSTYTYEIDGNNMTMTNTKTFVSYTLTKE